VELTGQNYANNKDTHKKQRNAAATAEKINQQSTHSGPKFSAAVMLHNNTFRFGYYHKIILNFSFHYARQLVILLLLRTDITM